jgi:tetratricopeptide (TPR) repeat protein
MDQDRSRIPNLLGMARTAVEAGNSDEAISYFNRVLEIDPTVSEAWLGKGQAVAGQSSLANVRLREMAVSFGHAIATAPEDEQQDAAHLAIAELTNAGLKTLILMLDHVAQFPGVQGTAELRSAVSLAILDAMDVGLRWMPNFEPGLRLIVSAGNEALAGALAPDQAARVQIKIATARGALRVINPDAAAAQDAAEADAAKRATIQLEEAARQKQVDGWAVSIGLGLAAFFMLLWLFTR